MLRKKAIHSGKRFLLTVNLGRVKGHFQQSHLSFCSENNYSQVDNIQNTDPGFDVTVNSHEEIVNKQTQNIIWSACFVLQPRDLVSRSH